MPTIENINKFISSMEEKGEDTSQFNWLKDNAIKKQEADDFVEKLHSDIQEFCGGDWLISDVLFGKLFEKYASTGNMDLQHLGWQFNKYVCAEVRKVLRPQLEEIWEIVNKENYTEDVPYNWNDDDNSLFKLDLPEKKALGFTSQNHNFLCVWSDYNLHIYRYWRAFDAEDEAAWEDEDYDFPKVLTKADAILRATELLDYSDNLQGNKYVYRPDLKWYIERLSQKNPESEYFNEGRILEISVIDHCEHALYHHKDISYIFFEVDTTLKSLKEEI